MPAALLPHAAFTLDFDIAMMPQHAEECFICAAITAKLPSLASDLQTQHLIAGDGFAGFTVRPLLISAIAARLPPPC